MLLPLFDVLWGVGEFLEENGHIKKCFFCMPDYNFWKKKIFWASKILTKKKFYPPKKTFFALFSITYRMALRKFWSKIFLPPKFHFQKNTFFHLFCFYYRFNRVNRFILFAHFIESFMGYLMTIILRGIISTPCIKNPFFHFDQNFYFTLYHHFLSKGDETFFLTPPIR